MGLEEEDTNVNYERRFVIYRHKQANSSGNVTLANPSPPKRICKENKEPQRSPANKCGVKSSQVSLQSSSDPSPSLLQSSPAKCNISGISKDTQKAPTVCKPTCNTNDINKGQTSSPKSSNILKTKYSTKLLSDEAASKTSFAQIASIRRGPISNEVKEYEDSVYSVISECVSIDKSVKYNLYAVVTNVKRLPTPTKGIKLMSQVYIADPSCQGTYGYPDFQFSLMGVRIRQLS